MKIKIGDTIYSGHDQPIMIIFEGKDKDNIANMGSGDTKYCQYHDTMSVDEAKEFMREEAFDI